ncbi:MAG: CRISPR-associated endonuclease Cas2 [Sphingobacteriales bacterium]|nr:CRISPR-associated endonuclease Cas2 [Sphingobacteriales bacterium]
MFTVVAYDISDDKRRTKIAKILEEYGVRKNYSVFECMLSRDQLTKMKKRIASKLKSNSDTVLYYYLCKECLHKAEQYGGENHEDKIIRIV